MAQRDSEAGGCPWTMPHCRPAARTPSAAATYYAAAADRDGFVARPFNQTADSYDRINAAFSLGSGAWYRRRALLRGGLRPRQTLLDVAVGTGLVAREAVRILGGPARVVGLDLSEGMLAGRAAASPSRSSGAGRRRCRWPMRASISSAWVMRCATCRTSGRLRRVPAGAAAGRAPAAAGDRPSRWRAAYAAPGSTSDTVVPCPRRWLGGGGGPAG